MLNKNAQDLLPQIFRDIVEQTAFMFAEAAEPRLLPPVTGPCQLVCMNFTGVFQGTVSIAVPVQMTMDIAANMLGVDVDDDAILGQGNDALKEMLNIICGHLLTSLAGSEPIFDLSIPEVRELEPGQWVQMQSDPDTRGILADDHPVLLRLELTGVQA